METTNVFKKNITAYNAGASLIVNQGGTRSSKTYSLMQLIFIIALYSKKKLIISVVSYALPHLKLGAMRDFEEIVEDFGMLVSDVKNVSESYFKIGMSIVEFFGVENAGKVHGPARDILVVNECNYVKYKLFDQLAIRTRKTIFVDFNPTSEFWYHEEIQGKLNHEFIKSTYLDNEHLTREQIERIEAKKNNKAWWKVYGEGELGRLEGAILTNWEYGSFDESLPYGYGQDFGSKDPDAIVKVAVDKENKKLYWKEVLYESSLSTDELISKMRERIDKGKLIIADSQAKRTITDIKNSGFNIKGVSKNKIVDDIKLLQNYKIIVDNESYNLAKELNGWVWLDKKGEIPLDDKNHAIDGARYFTQTILGSKKRSTQRVLG